MPLSPAGLGHAIARLVCASGAILTLGVSCNLPMPWHVHQVSPAVSGRIVDGDAPVSRGRLVVVVRHRENAGLALRHEEPLGSSGGFSLDPKELSVWGKEFSKHYRLFLHLYSESSKQTLWRAEYSRRAIDGSVELVCDLGRSPALGQACQVVDPTRYAWLVDAGRRDFQRLCASCHGSDGRGEGPAAAALQIAPSDLTQIASANDGRFPRRDLAEWIEGRLTPAAHGSRKMPIWGEQLVEEYARFPEAEDMVGARIDTLITYLETLQAAGS